MEWKFVTVVFVAGLRPLALRGIDRPWAAPLDNEPGEPLLQERNSIQHRRWGGCRYFDNPHRGQKSHPGIECSALL
jgi:hypothetical protein